MSRAYRDIEINKVSPAVECNQSADGRAGIAFRCFLSTRDEYCTAEMKSAVSYLGNTFVQGTISIVAQSVENFITEGS